MAKPSCFNAGDFVYYVALKGHNREKIFLDKKDYLRYLSLLSKYKARYAYRLYAFLLVPDQIMLVIKPTHPTLSKIMHGVNTTYTMYFNERHNRRGNLFQRRYKSLIVNNNEYLLDLTRYIHLYPLMSGLSENLEDYPWSSYSFYVKGYGSGIVDREEILRLMGEDIDYQVEEYKRLLKEKHTTLEETVDRGFDFFLEDFINRIKDTLEPDRIGVVSKGYANPSLSEILDIISNYYQIDDKSIFFGVRNRKNGIIRQMAIYISRIMGDKNLSELGEFFGGISYQAISKSLSSFEQRLRQQEDLKRDMEIVCNRIRDSKAQKEPAQKDSFI